MKALQIFGAIVLSLMAGLACAQQAKSPPIAPPLELIVLGSGGPGATGRAASSFLVVLDGKARILIDAGPGSFVRAGETKLSLRELDIVLLTHLHIDHAGELPGLFKARAVSSRGPISFRVYGPGGAGPYPSTQRFIDLLFGAQGAFAYLADFSAPMKVEATDITTPAGEATEPRILLSENGVTISAIAGHHRDAPAVIYRIDYKGRSVAFSGDIDAAGLPALRRLAKNVDLLVFNSVVLDAPASPPHLYELHTPPKAIGEVAAEARAGRLLLAHISPAVESQKKAVLASIRQSYKGRVLFAQDGLRLK